MENIDPFWFVTLVTLLSGAGGTGLGGVVGALCKSDSNRTISLLLAFAGGVMTAMVCFDLLAEAVEAATQASGLGVWIVVAAVIAGVAVVYGLNYVIDRAAKFRTWPMPITPAPTTTSTSLSTPTTGRSTRESTTRALPS